MTENYQMIDLTQNCSASKWAYRDVNLIRKCLGDNLASFQKILFDHDKIYSRSTLHTLAFFCLDNSFDENLDFFVDFHVPALTNGVKTDNLLQLSLCDSPPNFYFLLLSGT